MRISDWSSDVCSSDLIVVPCADRDRNGSVQRRGGNPSSGPRLRGGDEKDRGRRPRTRGLKRGGFVSMCASSHGPRRAIHAFAKLDRKRVVQGTSVSVRVDVVGRRNLKKNNKTN